MSEQVAAQPQSPVPTDNTDGQEPTSLCTKARIKKFFKSPAFSLIMGGTLLFCEVIIIALVLVIPESVGISEDDALTGAQRVVLGVFSIVSLIEAIFFGSMDTVTTRKKAITKRDQRKSQLRQCRRIQSQSEDPSRSITQVAELLKDQIMSKDSVDPQGLPELMDQIEKMLEDAVNHHTLKYIAYLVLDLATFFWTWAFALLVISNNWLSVLVTIAGGVVYPVVTFWQKAINPTP